MRVQFCFLWKSSKHMYCSHMTTQSYDRVVTWSGGHMIEWWKKAQEKSERNRDRGQMFLIEAVLISFILNTFPLNQQLQRGRSFSPFKPGFLNILMKWVQVFMDSMFYICRFQCHDVCSCRCLDHYSNELFTLWFVLSLKERHCRPFSFYVTFLWTCAFPWKQKSSSLYPFFSIGKTSNLKVSLTVQPV